MKKILILTTVHKINDVRIFYREIKSIQQLPVKIYFMVPAAELKKNNLDGIEIIPIPKAKNILSRIFINQLIAAKKILKIKPDIIHFHDPELMLLARLFKTLLKSKVIFDIHENVAASFKEKTWLPNFLKSTLTYLYPRIEKVITKKFDSLIIAEDSYQEIYGSKAIKILNYPILTKKKITGKSFEEPIVFVYAGSITELRGINEMLQIFLHLLKKNKRNVKLILAGDFYPESLETKIKNFVAENNIQDKVDVVGRLNFENVLTILEKSHIGFSILSPIENHIKSLPTKVFEYMMFGLPSIVSDFPIYDKYELTDKTVLKVDYTNIDNATGKILDLLDNKDRLVKMSKTGIELVKKKYNWATEEKKLLEIYKSLLNI